VLILTGEARVAAPRQSSTVFEDFDMPGLVVQRHRHFEALLDRARPLPPLPPPWSAPKSRTRSAARCWPRGKHHHPDPDRRRPEDRAAAPRSAPTRRSRSSTSDHAAAAEGLRTGARGPRRAVMKGHLHTDDLLRPMLDKANGLRVGRRFTHVFVMDVPGQHHPMLVTDAAINIAPDLATKVDIVQNAIDLARSLGMEPRASACCRRSRR
jgi:hypothetical protein